jgi:hypothetical protein
MRSRHFTARKAENSVKGADSGTARGGFRLAIPQIEAKIARKKKAVVVHENFLEDEGTDGSFISNSVYRE